MIRLLAPLLSLLFAGLLNARQAAPARAGEDSLGAPPPVGGCSIVAWDSATGDIGIALQSELLASGSVVPFAKAGVGAIVTMGAADAGFGPRALDMLGRGSGAREVVESLLEGDPGAGRRQIAVVDGGGRAFAATGSACQPYAGHITIGSYSVQGNDLSGDGVLKAAARTFETTPGDLAERLLAALEAGEKAGTHEHRNQSAALVVVRQQGGYSGTSDRFIDLRVDDDPLPLVELRRIYTEWAGSYLFDARMRSIGEFNRAKRFDAARVEMERAVLGFNALLRSRPDDPGVLSRVAWILATHDIDKERALQLAKRAAVLAPADSRILHTLAECHYRLAHYDEAVAIETALLAKEPANDEYWRQLQKFKDARQKAGR